MVNHDLKKMRKLYYYVDLHLFIILPLLVNDLVKYFMQHVRNGLIKHLTNS